MSTQQIAQARGMELRTVAIHGAISGLFFAQTVTWQQLVDVLIVHVFGVETDEPWAALWRAMLVTLFTTSLAWAMLTLSRRCESCVAPISLELRSSA